MSYPAVINGFKQIWIVNGFDFKQVNRPAERGPKRLQKTEVRISVFRGIFGQELNKKIEIAR